VFEKGSFFQQKAKSSSGISLFGGKAAREQESKIQLLTEELETKLKENGSCLCVYSSSVDTDLAELLVHRMNDLKNEHDQTLSVLQSVCHLCSASF
jgi:hypothetical protein